MYWCWVFSADWSRIVVFIYLTQLQAIRSITIVVFHVICCVKSEHRSWFLTVPTVNSWQSFWLRLFTLASISLKIKFHRINTSQNLCYKNSTTILAKILLSLLRISGFVLEMIISYANEETTISTSIVFHEIILLKLLRLQYK